LFQHDIPVWLTLPHAVTGSGIASAPTRCWAGRRHRVGLSVEPARLDEDRASTSRTLRPLPAVYRVEIGNQRALNEWCVGETCRPTRLSPL